AGEYRGEGLRDRRLQFFRYLKEKTDEWSRGAVCGSAFRRSSFSPGAPPQGGTAGAASGDRPLRLVHVMTVPQSLDFLRGQVGYLKGKGLEVRAVASPGDNLPRFGVREGVTVHAVEMGRRITPFRDCLTVL